MQVQASWGATADKELDSLIDEIGTKPGFEKFLRATNETGIHALASHGPIS
jgi:hypothetical protein